MEQQIAAFWLELFNQAGLPGMVCFYLLWRYEKKAEQLNQTINKLREDMYRQRGNGN